jgi:hypothetical protein
LGEAMLRLQVGFQLNNLLFGAVGEESQKKDRKSSIFSPKKGDGMF